MGNDIISNIEEVLKEKKIPKKVFLKDLGLCVGSFRNWRERGTAPKSDTISQMAEYLGVPVGRLLGEEEKEKTADAVLTKEQLALVMKVSALSPEKQEEALRYLDFLLSRQDTD